MESGAVCLEKPRRRRCWPSARLLLVRRQRLPNQKHRRYEERARGNHVTTEPSWSSSRVQRSSLLATGSASPEGTRSACQRREPPATKPVAYSMPGPMSDSAAAALPPDKKRATTIDQPTHHSTDENGRSRRAAGKRTDGPRQRVRSGELRHQRHKHADEHRTHGSCWLSWPLIIVAISIDCGAGNFPCQSRAERPVSSGRAAAAFRQSPAPTRRRQSSGRSAVYTAWLRREIRSSNPAKSRSALAEAIQTTEPTSSAAAW